MILKEIEDPFADPPSVSQGGANRISESTVATSVESTAPSAGTTLVDPFNVAFRYADKETSTLNSEHNISVSKKSRKWQVAAALVGLGLIIVLGATLGVIRSRSSSKHRGSSSFDGSNTTSNTSNTTTNAFIDPETPEAAYTIRSINGSGTEYILVYSDEFNVDGRSFAEGEDAFWQADDLHDFMQYELAYFDPSAVTTKNGSLEITLSKKNSHGLNYSSGMISTWNKFCFTGGRVEVRVQLPGANNVLGLWPRMYAQGNLARAGYQASLDGVWPYSYDSCDIGTVGNQTMNGMPTAAVSSGDFMNGLSMLPGQRLSRCTCSGEDHPGPKHPDGTFSGRGSQVIDIFQSMAAYLNHSSRALVAQSVSVAPFNADYHARNRTGDMIIRDSSVTTPSSYRGGVYEQVVGMNTITDENAYELTGKTFATYGFEYKPGFDGAYISWITNSKLSWTLMSSAIGPDVETEIGARAISQEPMYLVFTLGLSPAFSYVDLENLVFPAVLRVDYVRVYQARDSVNIGCSPSKFPTSDYIQRHKEAYSNPNFTAWEEATNQKFPSNSFLSQC